LYQRIKPKGHRRALAQPRLELLDFTRLYQAFPHFSPVLDLVRDQFTFAQLTGRPVLIPPVLLGGDPGIGKTRFSQELARALGMVMHRLPFDNGQSGVSLLGSDKNWANTTYGSVFELVVLGQYANPVLLLDEIDKASKRREGDALASLHSLLEPVTSEHVRDISLDFEFNASRVTWIATANELDRVPQSLRSRFHEFWIEQPTGAQALQMAEVVAQEVHQAMNLPGFQPPAQAVVHFIAHLTAREQIQALKWAYAATRVDGRHQIALTDLPEQVRREASEFTGDDAPPTGLLH
jgi:ATP-dependent Lon protease